MHAHGEIQRETVKSDTVCACACVRDRGSVCVCVTDCSELYQMYLRLRRKTEKPNWRGRYQSLGVHDPGFASEEQGCTSHRSCRMPAKGGLVKALSDQELANLRESLSGIFVCVCEGGGGGASKKVCP